MTSRIPRSARGLSLRQILPDARLPTDADILVHRLVRDPRQAKPGDLLYSTDDRPLTLEAASTAMARGASGILSEHLLPVPMPQCLVADAQRAAALIAQALAGQPAEELLCVGVMGTHGRSTCVSLAAAGLRGMRLRTATRCAWGSCDGRELKLDTRPDDGPEQLAGWLGLVHSAGCAAAVISLDRHMLAARQHAGFALDIALLTGAPNDSRQELDGLLFGQLLRDAIDQLRPDGVLVVNADCPLAMQIAEQSGKPMLTYGLRNRSDIEGKIIDVSPGCQTMLITAGDTAMPLESRYVGLHLARHQLAGVVIGMLSGNSLPQAIASVERASPLPGTQVRLVTPQEISVVVDRAATPERAHTVLQAMRSETTGRLWCIAGCPDQPAMASSFGHHLERLSHHPILTAQMGRKRDFLRDAHHVLDGVRKPGAMRLLPERPAAIAWALLKARPGDAVLILADPPTGNSAAEKHRCWNQAVAQVEELIAAHSADQTAAL